MTLVIGALIFGALILFLTSCKNKTSDNTTSENNQNTGDTLTTEVPQQFIDLLFGGQTINEMSQLSGEPDGDPNSFWTKIQNTERLVKEDKKIEAIKELRTILSSDNLDSRQILWAWNGLRELGEPTTKPIVLGLVLEVPQQNTTEYLAMYADQTARYINYTGKIAVWETSEANMDRLMRDVISKSQDYFDKQNLKKGRTTVPTDKVRFSFLTTNGIFQTEKPLEELTDQVSDIGDIFSTATEVLTVIVNSSTEN